MGKEQVTPGLSPGPTVVRYRPGAVGEWGAHYVAQFETSIENSTPQPSDRHLHQGSQQQEVSGGH